MTSLYLCNGLVMLLAICFNDSLEVFNLMLVLLQNKRLFIDLFLQVSILHLPVSNCGLNSFECDLKYFLLIKYFGMLFVNLSNLLILELTLLFKVLDLQFEFPYFLGKRILFKYVLLYFLMVLVPRCEHLIFLLCQPCLQSIYGILVITLPLLELCQFLIQALIFISPVWR